MSDKDRQDAAIVIFSLLSVIAGVSLYDYRAGMIVAGLTVGSAAVMAIYGRMEP